MSRILLLVLLLPLAFPAISEVYKTVDKDGNVVFTDTPGPDNAATAEPVEVPPINTSAAPQNIPALNAKPDPTPKGIPLGVTITSPANEAIIPRGPGNFSVNANPSAPLRDGEGLQLFIDGEAHGEPQASGDWHLTNIFRGQHDLTVSWIDDSGEILATSEPVRVFVFRPSSSFNKPKPKPPTKK
jgi:Domain of unknown function (DUF4124)